MTCEDVMTVNPKCCEPGESVTRAAQIMKDEDVGPIPIVNNMNEKRLLGIVTDRDIAIQVVAAGRDPNSTLIDEVMTRRPVTCHKDDDVQGAMEAMSHHQVRRVPVVDNEDRLVGIIAQADLARQVDEQEIGEVVEDISQPGHNFISRTFGRMTYPAQTEMAGTLIAGGLGLAMGATLMCLFDPTRGQARRERVRGAARSAYDQSASIVNKAGRALGGRHSGEQRSDRVKYEGRQRTPAPMGV